VQDCNTVSLLGLPLCAKPRGSDIRAFQGCLVESSMQLHTTVMTKILSDTSCMWRHTNCSAVRCNKMTSMIDPADLADIAANALLLMYSCCAITP
jgi:hypothetical protein